MKRAEEKPRRRHDRSIHEAPARGGGPLRTPDPEMEPQDGEVHLHRAQRHLHHRPAADPGTHRGFLQFHPRHGGEGRVAALRGDEEAVPGGDQGERHALRHALRHQPLARRHPHQLGDHQQAHREAQGAGGDGDVGRAREHAQEAGHPGAPPPDQAAPQPRGAAQHGKAAPAASSSSIRARRTSRSWRPASWRYR